MFLSHSLTKWKDTTASRYRLATMFVLDALSDHIRQMSSGLESYKAWSSVRSRLPQSTSKLGQKGRTQVSNSADGLIGMVDLIPSAVKNSAALANEA